MKRADILHTAEKCVCGQREQDYGSPENNFQTIADFWSVYKGVKFSACGGELVTEMPVEVAATASNTALNATSA